MWLLCSILCLRKSLTKYPTTFGKSMASQWHSFQLSYRVSFHPSFCRLLLALSFAFCFFFLFLFSYLACNAVVVFLYFHSKIVFGCWPTFSFYEGDKYCLLYAMLLFSVLEKSNREYIQHFFQLIWTEMFLLQIPFRMWHQANSASGIQLDFAYCDWIWISSSDMY